jgi:hypothetical protein
MRRVLLTALITTIVTAPAAAQVPMAARALGMGGAWIGMARGHEALFVNPANLGLPDAPPWSVSVLQVSAGGAVSGLPLDDLVDLVQFDDLSDADRDRLFGDVPATGLAADFDVRAPFASFHVGSLAMGVAFVGVGDHSISRDLVELFLYGYEEGRTDYSLDGTVGRRATFWDFAVGYGSSVGPLSWGVTGHYLRGGTLVRSWADGPRIDLIGRGLEVEYSGLRATGGSGLALDVGAAYQPIPTVTLSGSVINAYGRMDWSDDLTIRELVLTDEDFGDGSPRDILNRYEAAERPVEPNDPAVPAHIAAALRDEAYLPTTGTIGVAWRAATATRLSASYSDALTDGRLGGAWTRMAGAGVEQRIPWIAIRAGVASNFEGGSLLTGGLSLGPVDIGAARLSDADDRSGWLAMFGLSTRLSGR